MLLSDCQRLNYVNDLYVHRDKINLKFKLIMVKWKRWIKMEIICYNRQIYVTEEIGRFDVLSIKGY